MNAITLIDGYKFSHQKQYPRGTTRVYSNWTPRESRAAGIDHVVFFGLQYFLDRYLGEEFGRFKVLVRQTFPEIRNRLGFVA